VPLRQESNYFILFFIIPEPSKGLAVKVNVTCGRKLAYASSLQLNTAKEDGIIAIFPLLHAPPQVPDRKKCIKLFKLKIESTEL